VRILVWHVHGSWTTAFVEGAHSYLVPVVPDRGPDGRGRAETWDWPSSVVEITPDEMAGADIDVVVLQRPQDEELFAAWSGGRRAGRDVPAIWLEHNTPPGPVAEMHHPAADRDDLVIAHVTHTNDLFWDTGTTRTVVIEHGIVDPGLRFTGDCARAGVVVNDPERRGRAVGADLIPALAREVPVDLYGMGTAATAAAIGAGGAEDIPQMKLHDELAQRRAYVHLSRWTSLGLSLLEAMHLGVPVVALATTEVHDAVPPGTGIVTNRWDDVVDATRWLLQDVDAGAALGAAGRERALERYGLGRFLADWDRLLQEVVDT
jgi:hypothetical protein